jgi:Icc-related predicted phosphoesterase
VRILFTSDIHGIPDIYSKFADVLRKYDVGIIAGDLIDEYISDEDLMRMLNLSRDDFVEELPEPGDTLDDRLEAWRGSPQHAHLMRGLQIREQEFKGILQRAGKPVLVVPGNHDRTALTTDGLFSNIHMIRLDVDGVRFVGYGWIGSNLDPERQMARFHEVETFIDSTTVLVTHCPPFGTLDSTEDRAGMINRIGSRTLAEAVRRRKPAFHLFGHVHASAGFSANSVNGSYPNVSHFFGIETGSGGVWTEYG